ncbi:MAG: DUF4184 family protein [Clostridiaceae bacterium]|nr:DUF4184 family protein [Clostridiaceae bacterium]
MPFSFAHPVAVLPIKQKWKKYFNLTGLVLGSIAPDFEYFIRFKPEAVIGHDLTGFFLLNLPLCIFVAFLFHKLIKKPLILCLPVPFDKWYEYLAAKDWKINSSKEMLIFIYSSLVGMFTHVFWDAFTHESGKFVVLFSVLSKEIDFMDYSIPIYKFLQHGSTLIGGLAVLVCIFRIRRDNSQANSLPARYKLLYFITILSFGFILVLSGLYFSLIKFSFDNRGVIVVTFINGIILGSLFISCIINRMIANKCNKA